MAMEREIDFILSRTRTYFGSQTPQDTKYTNETKTALINNFPTLEAEYSKLKGTPQELRLFNKGQLVQNSYLYKSIFRFQFDTTKTFILTLSPPYQMIKRFHLPLFMSVNYIFLITRGIRAFFSLFYFFAL